MSISFLSFCLNPAREIFCGFSLGQEENSSLGLICSRRKLLLSSSSELLLFVNLSPVGRGIPVLFVFFHLFPSVPKVRHVAMRGAFLVFGGLDIIFFSCVYLK